MKNYFSFVKCCIETSKKPGKFKRNKLIKQQYKLDKTENDSISKIYQTITRLQYYSSAFLSVFIFFIMTAFLSCS